MSYEAKQQSFAQTLSGTTACRDLRYIRGSKRSVSELEWWSTRYWLTLALKRHETLRLAHFYRNLALPAFGGR